MEELSEAQAQAQAQAGSEWAEPKANVQRGPSRRTLASGKAAATVDSADNKQQTWLGGE
jgi:hypothetical protein